MRFFNEKYTFQPAKPQCFDFLAKIVYFSDILTKNIDFQPTEPEFCDFLAKTMYFSEIF